MLKKNVTQLKSLGGKLVLNNEQEQKKAIYFCHFLILIAINKGHKAYYIIIISREHNRNTKLPSCKHHSNTYCGQNLPMNAKIIV